MTLATNTNLLNVEFEYRLLQVANAAVNELGAATAGARREVVLLHHGRLETTTRYEIRKGQFTRCILCIYFTKIRLFRELTGIDSDT